MLQYLKGHNGLGWGVAISRDGHYAISGSSDRTVRVWDIETYKCISVLKGHTESVSGVAMSSDGRRAVSCSRG